MIASGRRSDRVSKPLARNEAFVSTPPQPPPSRGGGSKQRSLHWCCRRPQLPPQGEGEASKPDQPLDESVIDALGWRQLRAACCSGMRQGRRHEGAVAAGLLGGVEGGVGGGQAGDEGRLRLDAIGQGGHAGADGCRPRGRRAAPASACIRLRRRSTTLSAASVSHSGSSTANSSPPRRPKTSPGRSSRSTTAARRRSTASPAAWPARSLIALKSSMSSIATEVACPSRLACSIASSGALEEAAPVQGAGEQVGHHHAGQLRLRAVALAPGVDQQEGVDGQHEVEAEQPHPARQRGRLVPAHDGVFHRVDAGHRAGHAEQQRAHAGEAQVAVVEGLVLPGVPDGVDRRGDGQAGEDEPADQVDDVGGLDRSHGRPGSG